MPENTSRDRILARVRAATASAPSVSVPREYDRTRTGPDVIDLFIDRLVDYKANVHRDVTPASLLTGRRVAVPPGLPADWLTGVDAIPDDPPLSVADLDTVDSVLTACTVAIAETGTIILDAAPDQGRRILTLVPDHHVCIVHPDQIVRTVPEALTRLNPTHPQTWISGPSATSDIELNRVEGVHGPRTLDVLILGISAGMQ